MSTMCYHPCVGLDISPQGGFKPCCKYDHNISNNIDDYLHSNELTELKNTFLRGERPNACHRCWSEEDSGHSSKRTEDWKYVFNEVVPDITKLKILMFAFGNSCNLACRTCNSQWSSTWGVEAKKIIKLLPEIEIHKHNRSYQDANLINKLKTIGSNLTDLYFLGGEPFLAGIPEHLDLLEYFVKHNPHNMTLNYITNATIFPQIEFLNLWKKFKKVNIQLSIDGLENHFEYTRWPGKWNETLAIIDLYKKESIINSNIKLSIGHVVSIFTVYYLPEFYKWTLQNKLNDPYISLLSDPKMYNIQSLPIKIKDKISEKITRYKFDSVVKYMYLEDSSHLFDQALQYTKVLDQHRKQSFSETYSEFYQLVKEAGCQI